ncbi:hansenula MRAKII killer toxin-resistant protein 1 precursor [Penicillium canariense]|uniref:Hansenula MRAKII killer toxin-resistant protein 1 n=1 Tax=Penicillium canariense TaxID=189055 RepID=A0A9W9LEU6_9EURO|nr:hansenula MRAKII killer toxin-resistant protein 1 precursor [Penicillium canariense]KAJ5151505.1 hansenula MRAKII killer toxin-resistant protein 1 precursor [Penicillium canariense]
MSGRPPVVSSVNPTSGPAAGGNAVTIVGSGFTGATAVTFGSTAAAFTVNSNTQITAVTPPGPSGGGPVAVIIASPGGTSGAGVNYTYVATPVVSSVSPTSGPAAGGNTVSILGSGFTGATAVTFGSTPATFTVNSNTQITAVAPAGPSGGGPVPVVVTGPGGTSGAGVNYTYVATPAVSSVSPTSGPAAGGNTVSIIGSGFTGATAVKFGSTAATFTVNSNTQITAVAPAGPSGGGPVPVVVTSPGGTSATGVNYTYIPTPVVTSVSPTAGPAAGGNTVSIIGSGFTGATAVTFGSTPATFTVNSNTQISAVAPAGPSGGGPVPVIVTGPGGTSASGVNYTYVATPAVSSVSPTSGPAAGGTTVSILGSGFTGATAVTFGSTPATFTVNSNTQITAVAPAGPSGGGPVPIVVTGPGGTSASGVNYTYIPAPVVSAVSPTSGPAAGGTVVIIVGSGFTGATAVTFGSTPATFTVNSNTQITATAPAGPSGGGPVPVVVTSPGGTSASGVNYTYIPAPVVSSVSPTSGPVAGGTTVTIVGSGFTGATAVTFGSTPATFTVNSNTQITATAPAGPSGGGPVPVVVTGPGGTSASGVNYTYIPAPVVTSVSPTAGPAAGGNTVSIIGSGFTGATAVTFGSTPATFSVISNTQITAVAPAGPSGGGPVPVIVTGPGGTSASGVNYIYIPAPVVSSVSPISGPVAGGTVVTILGSGFTGATAVTFGSTAAAFTVDSNTQITATAPAGPSGGGPVPVFVTIPGGTSAPGVNFTYIPAPVVSSVSPTSGPFIGGTTVTILGSGFTGATAVNFGLTPATFTVNSNNQITAVSPGGTAGFTYSVLVTGPGGSSGPVLAANFDYV